MKLQKIAERYKILLAQENVQSATETYLQDFNSLADAVANLAPKDIYDSGFQGERAANIVKKQQQIINEAADKLRALEGFASDIEAPGVELIDTTGETIED